MTEAYSIRRANIQIDVVYDFLCPWCFVGKRHLDLALQVNNAVDTTVRWHQFMLYPEFDRGGHDFLAFFKSKYGEALKVPMWDAIRAVAKPIGIDFAFERMTRGPASLDGHRFIRWARTQQPGVTPAMYEDLASSFFEQAKIIDDDFLIGLAQRHGFDAAAAERHLKSDADLAEPFAENTRWREQGVSSMPHVIITFRDGHREIINQTSTEAFTDAFRRDEQGEAA